jgi:hypothetical protein
MPPHGPHGPYLALKIFTTMSKKSEINMLADTCGAISPKASSSACQGGKSEESDRSHHSLQPSLSSQTTVRDILVDAISFRAVSHDASRQDAKMIACHMFLSRLIGSRPVACQENELLHLTSISAGGTHVCAQIRNEKC